MHAAIEVHAAIERLSGNADFRLLASWIDGVYREEVASLLDAQDQIRTFQSQGYARALADLLTTFSSSREALERHSKAKP